MPGGLKGFFERPAEMAWYSMEESLPFKKLLD